MNIFKRMLFRSSLWTIAMVHTVRMYMRRLMKDTRTVHGVRVLVERGDGYVLLVRHWYAPGVWTLPGGGIKPNETPEKAAERELFEETGFTLEGEMAELGVYSGAREDDKVLVIIANKVRGSMRLLPDIEVMERGFFDMHDLPANTSPGNRRRIEEYVEGKRGIRASW